MIQDTKALSELHQWVESQAKLRWQIAYGIIPAVLGVIVLAASRSSVEDHIEINVISFVSVGLASALGGLTIQIVVLQSRLTTKLAGSGSIKLYAWDPARTPGLHAISRASIQLFTLVAVSTAAVELVARSVPGYSHAVEIRWFFYGSFIFGVLIGVFVGPLQHLTLYRMVRQEKLRSIQEVDDGLARQFERRPADLQRVLQLMDLRSAILATPRLPVSPSWVVPMLAALVGPLLAFALTG